MRPAGRSSSGRGHRPAVWSGASAGCCCGAGRRWTARTARPCGRSSPSTAGWPRRTCSRSQLAQLWTFTYAGVARRFLTRWLQALRWQRLPAFRKLGQLLPRQLEGILNDCHERVPFGKVEAINGNLRAMLRRGRGYRDHQYLLLKVQTGHRQPSPSGRMNRGVRTDSGEERKRGRPSHRSYSA